MIEEEIVLEREVNALSSLLVGHTALRWLAGPADGAGHPPFGLHFCASSLFLLWGGSGVVMVEKEGGFLFCRVVRSETFSQGERVLATRGMVLQKRDVGYL